MRRNRRHRWGIAIATAAVVTSSTVAVPVGAEAGVLTPIATAFGWTHHEGSPLVAADATGRLLLTTQGPPGHAIQLYEATSTGGGQCISVLSPSEPANQQLLDASCTSAGAVSPGVQPGATTYSPSGETIILYAPGAAYMTLNDGLTTRRLPVVDGLSAILLPALDESRTLTLTGYNGAGTPIGRFPFVQAGKSTVAARA